MTSSTSSTPTALRTLGHCQCCEGEFKLHKGRMVHHGYQRPGHGQIVGDCPAVDVLPYETSCAWLRDTYLPKLRLRLSVVEEGIATLPERTSLWAPDPETRYSIGAPRMIELRLGVTAPWLWDQEMKRRNHDLANERDALTAAIPRVEKRIADWTPRPVREVTEAQLTAERKAARDAANAPAKAERAAKKAAREKHAAELKAKRDEREKSRQGLMADFKARFLALLAEPAGRLREDKAVALSQELRKGKATRFGQIWLHEVATAETLIALKLWTA